jgi:hypothetical protein
MERPPACSEEKPQKDFMALAASQNRELYSFDSGGGMNV